MTTPKTRTKRELEPPDQEPRAQETTEREPTKPATLKTRAEEMLESYQAEQARTLEKIVEKDRDEYVYLFKCDVCQGPGIFFTDNPSGKLIKDTDWYATYKDVNDFWPHQIMCQSCESKGRETGLPIRFIDRRMVPAEFHRMNCFRVQGRHLRLLLKMPRDPERAAREPFQRAVPYDGKSPHTLQITHPER